MSAYCKQQLETGIMPDIYSTTQAWDGSLQQEQLIDLSRYSVSEQYSTARLDEYMVDGGVYLLPFDFSIVGMLCNETLLEENGIEIPDSFEQLRDETIPTLQEKNIKVADCLLDLPGSAFQYFFNVCSGEEMNTLSGREFRADFIDTASEAFASDSEKLTDALHVLEVLSTNEGYLAINGELSTNMCSLSGFEIAEDSPYTEAMERVSHGYAMNMVYTGWDAYLVPFGEALLDWISGKASAKDAFAVLDETKRQVLATGVTTYGTVTEELDTVQAAQLSGQMFMEATDADAALIREVPAIIILMFI